ncbi:1-acyl-sn-glycerol-3-phosphate acyltransferase [Thermoproteota archaeon]
MGYINSFLRRDKNPSHDTLSSLLLSYQLAEQMLKEIGGSAEQRIKEPYLAEKDVAEWRHHINNTLQAKMFEHYFKPKVHDAEKLPEDGALLVSNHSGMWAVDVAAANYALTKETGRPVSGIVHNIFKGSDIRKTLGIIIGNPEHAKEFLQDGRLLMVCPGGAEDVAKPFWHRYFVLPFNGFARGNNGYLLLALEAKKPVVPMAIVGAEETHIHLGNIKPPLDDIVDLVYKNLPQKIQKKTARFKKIWDSSTVLPLMLNLFPFPSTIETYVREPIYVHKELEGFPSRHYMRLRAKNRMGKMTAAEENEFEELDEIIYKVNERVMDSIQDKLNEWRYKGTGKKLVPLTTLAEPAVKASRA